MDNGGTLETLYMGLAVGVVILAAVYASNSMKEGALPIRSESADSDGVPGEHP